jgi:hypothetical protein
MHLRCDALVRDRLGSSRGSSTYRGNSARTHLSAESCRHPGSGFANKWLREHEQRWAPLSATYMRQHGSLRRVSSLVSSAWPASGGGLQQLRRDASLPGDGRRRWPRRIARRVQPGARCIVLSCPGQRVVARQRLDARRHRRRRRRLRRSFNGNRCLSRCCRRQWARSWGTPLSSRAVRGL